MPKVAGLDDTQVLVVAQGEERASLLRTVAHGEVVLLDDTRACGFVHPVGVGVGHGVVGVQVLAS